MDKIAAGERDTLTRLQTLENHDLIRLRNTTSFCKNDQAQSKRENYRGSEVTRMFIILTSASSESVAD
jgi:hypothetical protein